jgi:hypothetical protein
MLGLLETQSVPDLPEKKLDEVFLHSTTPFSDSPVIYLSTVSDSRITTLIDSGSSDCFMDPSTATSLNLSPAPLEHPLRLCLFDGSSASAGLITKAVNLICRFPHGPEQELRFLLTPLDSTVGAVLGHQWLQKNNLDIDWTTSSIRTFCPSETPAPGVIPDPPIDPKLALDDPTATLQAAVAKIDI